jgi:hypothetical protein
MTGHKHIIKTITFDTAIANEELVDRWRNTVSRVDIESVFAKVLQHYDFDSEWTCIDRLEIDLGEMSWENEEEWSYKIGAALQEQLSEKIRFRNGVAVTASRRKALYGEAVSDVVIVDDDGYRLQALTEYLKTGVCSWRLQKLNDLGTVLMELTGRNPVLVEERLRVLLKSSVAAADRLLIMLDHARLIRIIKVFVSEDIVDELISLYAIIEKFSPVLRKKVVKQKMIRKLLECAVVHGNDIESIIKVILPEVLIAGIEISEWNKIKTHIVENSGNSKSLIPMIENLIVQKQHSERQEVVENGNEENHEIELNTAIKQHSDVEEDAQAEIFVHNSGLVLLNAALIKVYFEKLGWVQQNDFRNERARTKAMLWLHYLTHGNTRIHEYELSLVKILCGILPSEIANVKLKLTKMERDAADELITTVIEHWAALKKVSVEGLRQSFLQREGRLTNDEAGWQLHVESKAYDMLIERLPWSYNIIKFPWMTKPLFTQWSTQI